MTIEVRTENDAEAGIVQVRMGGEWFSLPVLTIEQSEEWQAGVGAEIASLDDGLDPEQEAAESITTVLRQGSLAMRRIVVAYDRTEVLGGEGSIRQHMTQRELWEATERILDAEFPFDTTAKRSVAEMFGLPLRALEIVTQAVTEEASRRAKYPNGVSPIGASPTPSSDANGRENNSQSAGPTDSGASRKRRRRT